MQFIHYKEMPPINLAKVGSISKENQQVTKEASLYALGFYEFERKVGYWLFQSEEERDNVFEWVKAQFSKEISPTKSASQSNTVKPAFLKG